MINKTIAIAIGFMVFFAAGTAFIMLNEEETDHSPTISVLAMVNAEGSGIFSKDKNLDINDKTGWGGKTFMTPGPGSIQHEMLKSMAQDFNMEFVSGTGSDKNTIYWAFVTVGNMDLSWATGAYDGGIAWEPWFTKIVTKYNAGNPYGPAAYSIATTDEIEPGHPCCMIAADNNFINNNEELTIRFLLAYIDAVEWVNEAISDRNSNEYKALERVAWETAFGGVGSPTSSSDKDMIWDAISNITYKYDIESGIVGYGLKKYTAELINRFYDSGAIVTKLHDPVTFADKLINYDMLSDALDGWSSTTKQGIYYDPNQSSFGTLRLAVLQLDLHQIALRVAMDKDLFSGLDPSFPAGTSLFDAYGVNISLAALQPNGPGVMNLFAAGEIDIGVLGLPPIAIRTVNGL